MNTPQNLLKKISSALSFLVLLVSSVSWANETGSQKKYKAPSYGMAGCGPASSILSADHHKNSVFFQMVGAAININLSYLSYPSAITSGTSNCQDSALPSSEASKIEREAYVSMNLSELNKQAAQGDGNHLRGLAEMIGCGNEIQFELFAAVAQMEHDEIFSDSNGSKVSDRLMGKLKENSALEGCLKTK
jgi:hypothetical protein